MKVYDVDVWQQLADVQAKIGIVLGDEVAIGKQGFLPGDPLPYARLPRHGEFIGEIHRIRIGIARRRAEIRVDDVGENGAVRPWLVLEFKNYIVEGSGFTNYLPGVFFLVREDVSVFKSVEFLPVDGVGAVNVVGGI